MWVIIFIIFFICLCSFPITKWLVLAVIVLFAFNELVRYQERERAKLKKQTKVEQVVPIYEQKPVLEKVVEAPTCDRYASY